MKNRERFWVAALAVMLLMGGTIKANAEKWERSNERFISPEVILRDNLNDEFGPATDKLLKMQEEGEEGEEARRAEGAALRPPRQAGAERRAWAEEA
jgi:hypothetical protein